MEYLDKLPEWARIVSVLIFLTFGTGGISNLLTQRISAKKIEKKEGAVESIEVKGDREVEKDILESYKEILAFQNVQRKDLQKQITENNNNFLAEKEITRTEIEGLKASIQKQETKLKKLTRYIGQIKQAWKAKLPHEPFPEYREEEGEIFI